MPDKLERPETYYPLKVVRCDHCLFVQLSYVVAPEILYQEDYPYESSLTRTGQKHFDALAESVIDAFSLKKGDLAVDIGSNVGVLLKGFAARGCRIVGIDPAVNIARQAEDKGIPMVPRFFTPDTAAHVKSNHGPAKVITATNVFAHVHDLMAFMKGVDILLDSQGIFIIEAPYLEHMLTNLEYDTIYHEHLSYLSLTPLISFFDKCGFQPFRVRQVDIHGGSFRLYIARVGQYPVENCVTHMVDREKNEKVHTMGRLSEFAERAEQNRNELVEMLMRLKKAGNRIAGVSAPAKGMTLLNYCKIDSRLIDFVTEKSLLKIGRYTPGGHLPVRPDDALIEEQIDYGLLLAWNFSEEIMRNLSAFKEKGGKFIIPIPNPMVI